MNARKRLILVVGVLVFLSTLTFSLFHPQKVAAAAPSSEDDIKKASYNFIDHAHLEVTIGGTKYTFFDQNIGDKEPDYAVQGSDCYGHVSFYASYNIGADFVNGKITPYSVDIDYKPGGVGQCRNTQIDPLVLAQSTHIAKGNVDIWYEWLDSQTIRRVDGDSGWIFAQTRVASQSKQLFVRTSGGGCGDYIIASTDFTSHKIYRMEDNKQNGRDGLSDITNPDHDILQPVFPNSCELWGTRPSQEQNVDYDSSNSKVAAKSYPLGSVANATKTPGAGGGTPGVGNTGSGDQNVTCEKNWNNPLSWILCPVFNGIADLSDWLFNEFITPFLQSSPVSTDSSDPTYQIWSGFRIYGNVLLVIAMIVIVFGQTIGGGLIDAYTAKKVLPRILTAAILINLSVYIVAFMVDVTNIVGKGIGQLMISPIRSSIGTGFHLSIGQSLGGIGLGVLGLMLGASGIAGVLGALVLGGGAAIQAGLFVGLLTLLPVILSIIGVFVTLVIRRGLILFLIIISPFAFALYCLPNTERYFKKWWELLFKTLLVYPIVIIIFAIADIMSVTILKANGVAGVDGQINNVLAAVVAFVLQFLPLLMIPFAFKFAGGAIGSIHAAITGGAGKLNGMFEKRKEYAKKDWRARTLSARDRQYRGLETAASQRGIRGAAARFARARVGGYNLEEAIAAQREAENKLQDLQNNNGDDTEQRALTVNKAWALAQADGEGKHWRIDKETGAREFRTLGGAWVKEASVDAAHSRWGGNQMALQWSLGHEMDKAATQEEQDYLVSNYGRLVDGGLGEGSGGFAMNDKQAQGVWKGAGFQKQNANRQWKHYGWKGAGKGMELDGLTLMREIDEKQGNYQMLMQNADTWTSMSEEVRKAKQIVDGDITGVALPQRGEFAADKAGEDAWRAARKQALDESRDRAAEILQRASRIAHATKSASFGGGSVIPAGEGGAPIPAPVVTDDYGTEVEVPIRGAAGATGGTTRTGGGGRAIGAGAPGRVMEEANAFVQVADMFAGEYKAPGSEPGTGVPEQSLNRRDR